MLFRSVSQSRYDELQNITCAITTGQKPGFIPRFKNMARSEAPRTTSGVAIGKKINVFVVDRPLNWWRPRAKAINVPRKVAATVEINPTRIELPSAKQTSGAPQGFCQLPSVNPFQTRLLFPPLLNEKANVYATGTKR